MLKRNQLTFVWIVMIPTICFYIVFLQFPVVYAAFLSFFKWNMSNPEKPFVAWHNYVKIFSDDPIFRISLLNTFYLAALKIPIELAISLAIAILLNSIRRGSSLFRTIYFMPAITSMVACAILWKWLYQPRFGLFNQVLEMMGLPGLGWLNSNSLALPSVMLMTVWRGMGYTIVILLAGLQGIPEMYYEAAKIDGANRWQIFRRITLPLLQPTLLFTLVVGMIVTLQVFGPVYVMTNGGPVHASRVLVLYIYDTAFHYLDMGYASAMAFVLFAIIFTFSLIQLRVGRVRWEY